MEVPRAAVWKRKARTNAAKGNAAEPSLGKAKHTSTPTPPRRAEGQRTIQPSMGTSLALPLGAGKRNWRGVWKGDNATPNAAAPRPMGQRPSWDEHGDASRTMPHRERRGGYRLNFSSSPKATARAVLVSFSLSLGNANARPRRERDNQATSQPNRAACLRTPQPFPQPQLIGKGAWRGGWRRKGDLHPFLQPSSCDYSPPTPW